MGFQYVRGASGAAGSGLPAGTADGQALIYDSATGLWALEGQHVRCHAFQWGAVSYGAAASGELHPAAQSDITGAASALPLNQQYNGQTLPTIGGYLVGFEVHQHFNVPGIAVNWKVYVNGVLVPAFNLVLGAAAWRAAIWPTPVAYAANALNVANVTFDMAAPIAGNTRPGATLWVTAGT